MTPLSTQLDAARSAALVVDETSRFGALVVRGADRRTWLNGLVTSDMTKLTPGAALYGLAVTPKGRVLTDLVFVEAKETILVLLPMSEVEAVAAALDHYLVMEDAELEAAAAAYRIFAIHGPKSEAVLASLGSMSEEQGVAASMDWLGLGGGVVIAHADAGSDIFERLEAGAASVGGAVGTADAAELLRISRGVPRFGQDFGATTYPQEAGLETRAVSFDKGCYLGQEVVCMLQLRGHVKRKLVSLELDEGTASAGAAIEDDAGQKIGEVTSVAEDPAFPHPIAIGMVKLAFTQPGTSVRVSGGRATVIDPAVDAAALR